MARLTGLACILALLIASSGSATVIEEPLCCYCAVQDNVGQVPFCGLLTSRSQEMQVYQQCLAQGGAGLKCLVMPVGGQAECNAELADLGINCPIRNGVPTASASALGVLSLAFAAVGIFAVRRRAASTGD
jgi:hypothetical protein